MVFLVQSLLLKNIRYLNKTTGPLYMADFTKKYKTTHSDCKALDFVCVRMIRIDVEERINAVVDASVLVVLINKLD